MSLVNVAPTIFDLNEFIVDIGLEKDCERVHCELLSNEPETLPSIQSENDEGEPEQRGWIRLTPRIASFLFSRYRFAQYLGF